MVGQIWLEKEHQLEIEKADAPCHGGSGNYCKTGPQSAHHNMNAPAQYQQNQQQQQYQQQQAVGGGPVYQQHQQPPHHSAPPPPPAHNGVPQA